MMSKLQSLPKILPKIVRIFRHFSPYLRCHRFMAFGSLCALLGEVGLRLLEPWPLKFVFDYVIGQSNDTVPADLHFLRDISPMALLTLSALAIVVIAGFRAACSYSKVIGFALIGNRVLTDVRNDFYRHLQTLSLGYHSKAKSGDLVVRIIADIGLLKDVTVTAFLPLIGNVLILLGMVIVMFMMNWRLALVSVLIFPFFWFFSTRITRRVHEVVHKQRKRQSAMASTAAESLGAIKTVQALSLEENFTDAFTSQSKKDLKDGVKAKRLAAGLERTADLLIATGTALVIWYGSTLVLRNVLTPGDIIVFLAYLKSAFRPLRSFAKYTARIAKATAASERILNVFEEKPEVRDLPGAVTAPSFQGKVHFDHVHFAYDPDAIVLKDFNFDAGAGQKIAIVGASGIGKSTLVGLLLRLYDPADGRVLIDGQDIRDFTLKSLRSQIGVVLQDNLLFSGTIKENIAAVIPEAKQQDIEAAAKLANAHDFIMTQPQGYETLVGERGSTLSRGQCQRIAIARAALLNTRILILDEPTTGLDKANEQNVIQSLLKLAHGRTTFIVTHNLDFAAFADQILFIDYGRVVELGNHHELVAKNGRYASFYQSQVNKNNHELQTGGYHALEI